MRQKGFAKQEEVKPRKRDGGRVWERTELGDAVE